MFFLEWLCKINSCMYSPTDEKIQVLLWLSVAHLNDPLVLRVSFVLAFLVTMCYQVDIYHVASRVANPAQKEPSYQILPDELFSL